MTIRAFDGSLADAKGLLAVERATFDESPYNAEQVQAMLSRGPQRAWLAVEDGEVAGFCIAFRACSMQAVCWEIDLLAVHPDWEGQGLGRRLVRCAAAGAGGEVNEARAVVAADNERSARAFAAAGFRPEPSTCELLIHRLDGPVPPLQPVPGLEVRRARSLEEAAPWLGSAPALPPARRRPVLVLAEQNRRPAGYAELLDVQTLLYRGTWIESLPAPSRLVREMLIGWLLHRAESAGLDEVSALVEQQNRPLQHTLLAAGFQSLGAYRRFSARLPLPTEPDWRDA